jgi:hypothetical protein
VTKKKLLAARQKLAFAGYDPEYCMLHDPATYGRDENGFSLSFQTSCTVPSADAALETLLALVRVTGRNPGAQAAWQPDPCTVLTIDEELMPAFLCIVKAGSAALQDDPLCAPMIEALSTLCAQHTRKKD